MKKYFLFFSAFLATIGILLTAPRPTIGAQMRPELRAISGQSVPESFEKKMLKVEPVLPDRPNSAKLVIEPVI